MSKGFRLDFQDVVDIRELMEGAGFEQCDADRFTSLHSRKLWDDIRCLVTGQARIQPQAFHPAKANGGGAHRLERIGEEVLLDGVPLMTVRCMDVAKTYGELAQLYPAERHPSRSVLEVLVDHPHLIPQSWRSDFDSPDLFAAFLSTRREDASHQLVVEGISTETGPSLGLWEAEDDQELDDNEYLVIISEP